MVRLEINGLIRRMFVENGLGTPTTRTLSKWIAQVGVKKTGYPTGQKTVVIPIELHVIANLAWAIGKGMSRKNVAMAIEALNKARETHTERDNGVWFRDESIGRIRTEFVVFEETHFGTWTRYPNTDEGKIHEQQRSITTLNEAPLPSVNVFRFETRTEIQEMRLSEIVQLPKNNYMETISHLTETIPVSWLNSVVPTVGIKGVFLKGDVGIVRTGYKEEVLT